MNKKLIISLGLVAAISASTVAAMAETTIYTDAIGRMHFLGRDAANNTNTRNNYTNSAEQDLTRKLYEQRASEEINDTDYSQHPVKNYLNTFPDSRFGVTKWWKTREATEDDYKTVKGSATATKGESYSSINAYGSNVVTNPTFNNASTQVEEKTQKKVHWWNKKAK